MTPNKHNATCIQLHHHPLVAQVRALFMLKSHQLSCCRFSVAVQRVTAASAHCYNPIFQSLLKCNQCALMKMPRMTKHKKAVDASNIYAFDFIATCERVSFTMNDADDDGEEDGSSGSQREEP